MENLFNKLFGSIKLTNSKPIGMRLLFIDLI